MISHFLKLMKMNRQRCENDRMINIFKFVKHLLTVYILQKKPKMSVNRKSKIKVIGKKSASKNDSILSNQEQPTAKASDTQSWPHLKYDFLQPNKIKDNMKRPASHPDYDPKTVYVPPDFLSSQTPVRHYFSNNCKATLIA
jgi:hypothetical protein